MTNWIVLCIYLSFVLDFGVFPIPSEASTIAMLRSPRHRGLRRCLEEATKLDLRPGILEKYLYENAQRLFFADRD